MDATSTKKRSKKAGQGGPEGIEQGEAHSNGAKATTAPRSLAVAIQGVTTGAEFAALMSALMSDVIEGTIDPSVANAACNAGGKLLKVVEMQHRFRAQPQDEVPLKLVS